MGTAGDPLKVMIFASILSQGDASLRKALELLTAKIDLIEEQTSAERFTYTSYYEREMGSGLLRIFVLFKSLKNRDTLADIKIATNSIEQALAVDSRRTVNIDPGYIALEHVILATTKGYSHRVYLRDGIYADLTLIFNNGTYRPLEWSYPDYSDKSAILLFNNWRERYKKVLRCQKV